MKTEGHASPWPVSGLVGSNPAPGALCFGSNPMSNILLLPNEASHLKPKIKQKVKFFDSENYDIHNYAQRLRLAHSKIQKETCLSDEDKELLTKFAKYLEAMDLNAGRTAKAIYQLVVLRRHVPCKSFVSADRGGLEELVTRINRDSHYRPWTKSDAKGLFNSEESNDCASLVFL